MSDFAGMEELLQDFLTEAGELLGQVDNKLVDLEKTPDNRDLLNDIFRGFHTIKGGAGFLGVEPLIALCHRTENLFDKLRNGKITLNPELMDAIMAATATVRDMFGALAQSTMPGAADPALIASLEAAASGQAPDAAQPEGTKRQSTADRKVSQAIPTATPHVGQGPDWQTLYDGLLGNPPASAADASAEQLQSAPMENEAGQAAEPARPQAVPMQRASQAQAAPPQSLQKETTVRVDTARLDQVLNLSGEIGLTKNRIACLKGDILHGHHDADTLKDLDAAVGQLELLVADLQNAVMKTRMQPIGRLFQKYPRLARDLARQLGKEVELVISGEDTELDKTMIEDLNDPLVHLVRNAVDHGVELPQEREAAGKPVRSLVTLSAWQSGDHVFIEIADDGAGMSPEAIRNKAVEKGIIDMETANSLDERQSLQLILLPGFTTKDQISNVSGRGVGMDVVKTNIQNLNGRIDVVSVPGSGSTFTISLPLTLAILPVLVVRLNNQSFAVPLSLVREIIPIHPSEVQRVSGRATMVLREEVLPVRSLASLLGWQQSKPPGFGVLIQTQDTTFIMAVDGFVGRDDVVIKPLSDIKPKGIAGATLSGDGSIVLVLDLDELLGEKGGDTPASLFGIAA
jgi:two-component system, chemotaxis family, sensor kinase CheA